MGAKARVYKKTRTPPLHSGVGCDIRPKLHRKRRIWVAKANPGVFFPEFDEALCHLSMGSTSLPHTSPQTATNPSSSPVFSVSEQQGVYLSVAVPEEAGFTSSECKRDEEKPAEPEGSTSVLSPGSTTLAISGISTDSIKGVSANSISGSNKNFTYRELGHNEVTLGLKNDVFPHLNDAPLESLNTGVDLSSVAWTQPCATAIVGLNIIRPSRVGGTLVMDIDHIVGGSSDVGHYWQVNSAVVNSGRHTNVHGGNLMDSRQVQYSPPVVGCTRAVEAVRPNFVVNFGKRADSGGGRNSMPQDSQVAPPNFGPNPFNYMTGPFSATHVGANLNQIGIAPTSHVSTVEPHTMPQPSFGPNFGSIYTPIPHTGPQVKPSYNQPNPYLPQTHTYTFPGNQTYPPHPIFGTQTAHGAWLQQSPTSYQQTHSTLPHYTPPLSTPPNLNFAHQNPNFAFQNPNFDQSLPTMKPMKLEFTTFNGGDPVEWISKAEQFFEFYQVPEERKLAIGTMHLVEKASDRRYMFKHEFQQNWQGLTELLMREFGGYHASEYQAALAVLSQEDHPIAYLSKALAPRHIALSVKRNLQLAQSRMEFFYDKYHTQREFGMIIYSEVTNGYTIPTVDLRCITDRADTFGVRGFSIPGPFGHHRVWINDTICFSRQLENLEALFLSEQEVLHQLITSDLSRGTAETVMQHTTTCLTNVALLLGLWLLTLTEEIRKLLILVYSYPCQLTSYCLSILLSAIGKWMHGVDWMISTVKVNGMVSTAAFLAQSRPGDMPCSKGGGMLGLLG